jgi:DNA-binding MarR family transcriptional regulator
MSDSPNKKSEADQLFLEAIRLLVAEAMADTNELLKTIDPDLLPTKREDICPAMLGGSRNLDWAKRVYAIRRRRTDYLPAKFLGEPGWDILLDLYIAFHECRTISVSSACLASGIPATTALRTLNLLIDAGLVHRIDDDKDRRVSWVCLTKEAIWSISRIIELDTRHELDAHLKKRREIKKMEALKLLSQPN